jgi:hypothetical protein
MTSGGSHSIFHIAISGDAMRRWILGCSLAAVVLAGCDRGPITICGGVGYYAIAVTLLDDQGNPAALGATLTLDDGPYHEVDSSLYDPLQLFGAPERSGRRYDLKISKPHYQDIVAQVNVPGGDECVSGGASIARNSVALRFMLSPLPNAPPVRSIRLYPPSVLLDRSPGRTAWAFTPYVDAAPGTSRAIAWSIAGDTASVGFDAVTGVVTYRCRPTSGYLTVTARSLVDPSVFGEAKVSVQGHPGAPSDPPCS